VAVSGGSGLLHSLEIRHPNTDDMGSEKVRMDHDEPFLGFDVADPPLYSLKCTSNDAYDVVNAAPSVCDRSEPPRVELLTERLTALLVGICTLA
jgi:hypothetical protein